MIAVLFALFIIGLIFAFGKQSNTDKETAKREPNKKKRNPKVQSWHKYQKKAWKAKAHSATFKAQFVVLSIDEANELFVYNHSEDEMMLIDVILDAKLNGTNFVKIDRSLYERMKSEKGCL